VQTFNQYLGFQFQHSVSSSYVLRMRNQEFKPLYCCFLGQRNGCRSCTAHSMPSCNGTFEDISKCSMQLLLLAACCCCCCISTEHCASDRWRNASLLSPATGPTIANKLLLAETVQSIDLVTDLIVTYCVTIWYCFSKFKQKPREINQ
jgi:hypothetical protein